MADKIESALEWLYRDTLYPQIFLAVVGAVYGYKLIRWVIERWK